MTETKEIGSVGIPGGYFLKMAKADYNNYRQALPREFYQNSADAGATVIEVTTDSENRRIDVYDNGCGMTKEILKDKLLVLGGSHKEGNATGAFGKAKELLFFSWDKYEIRTNNILVEGKGANYEISTDPNPQKQGTMCSIWVGADEDFDNMIKAFKNVAEKMEVTAKISVNTENIPCTLRKGAYVKDFGWATLYHDSDKESQYMSVRINGIWMFERYVGETGKLVLEISKHSLECMTSNRDNLNWKYRDELDDFVKQLAADRKSALEPEKEVVRALIGGDGEIELKNKELEEKDFDIQKFGTEIAEELDMEGLAYSGTVKDAVLGIAKIVAKNGGDLETTLTRIGEVVKEQNIREDAYPLSVIDDLLEDWSEVINFIGYDPDFEIEFEEGQRRNVKKYMKTKYANTIAKMWTETVKQVMLDNRIYQNFTAGFTFRETSEAQIRDDENKTIIYLNPSRLGVEAGWNKKPLSNRKDLMEELKDLAIHEIAHLRCTYHDENFVSEMHRLRIHTRKSDGAYLRISRIKVHS